MNDFKLTVITPTVGRKGLKKLIDSINNQEGGRDEIYHIILWDDTIKGELTDPSIFNSDNTFSIQIPGSLGNPYGSHLRAVGLMMAETPWVTLADDDVWWEADHYNHIKEFMDNPEVAWGGVRRNIWNPFTGNRIGVDNFESVGDSKDRRVPYEMLDGNTMFFKREYGSYAAPLYRETWDYNDDRQMYAYLKDSGDGYVLSPKATVNQVCPEKLVGMFESNCTK